MDSRQQFEEWHIDNSIDHYKPYKDQLFAAWQAGRASMRDEAATRCEWVDMNFIEHPEMAVTCKEEIKKLQP